MYFVCVILFCYVIAFTTAAGLNPRSVNVNLETVLQFEPQDNSDDIHFLENIQKFLGKVKTVIDRRSGRRSQIKQETNIKFTNFIKKAIEILRSYSDDDLEDVFDVLDNEIRKYHYKGCKFHELIQNQDLRRFVASKLNKIQDQDGKHIKKTLSNVFSALEDAEYDYKQADLIQYVNSLYRHNDVGKMKSFLNEIEAYKVKSKRANLDLLRIIRNGVRDIIFDHYSKLNANARNELRFKIESFWNPKKGTSTTTTTAEKNKFNLANSFKFLRESFWDSGTTSTTTEATTTKKKFDIANSFNFLRDFTFEFITPETFSTTSMESSATETTKYSMKPKPLRSHNFTHKVKTDVTPEDMPNYTDNEELKHKSTEKSKKKKNHKHKKDKEHKKKKRTHKKKSQTTIANKHLSSKHKHKTKKHKTEQVFRQHDIVKPANIFDYKAVINVRGETDESDSNELRKSNESVKSSLVRSNSKSETRKRDFRKNIATDSEEGMSIDFKPSNISLSHTERTIKHDDSLLRRLNNLERVVKIFESKIKPEDSEEINVKSNIKKKSKTVKPTKYNKSPTTIKHTSVESSSVENIESTPVWLKLSKKVQNIEAVTKISKPVALSYIQDSVESIPDEKTQSPEVVNKTTMSTWQKESDNVQNIQTASTWQEVSQKVQNMETESTWQEVSQNIQNMETESIWKQTEKTEKTTTQQQKTHKPTTTSDKIQSKLTTKEITTTTPKVINNQHQNTTNVNFRANQIDFTINENNTTTSKNDFKIIKNTTKQNDMTTYQHFKDDQNMQYTLIPNIVDNDMGMGMDMEIPSIQNGL